MTAEEISGPIPSPGISVTVCIWTGRQTGGETVGLLVEDTDRRDRIRAFVTAGDLVCVTMRHLLCVCLRPLTPLEQEEAEDRAGLLTTWDNCRRQLKVIELRQKLSCIT